jgi:3-hydroxyisobutyrate dehydrogenase-like beta-hydroxyacid dehydrogenase
MTEPRVAVVGLGKMGEAIAERIVDAGYPLAVFNRTAARAEPLRERGATVLAAAADALLEADICVTSLADDSAVDDILLGADGVLAGARPGSTLVEMSTISVESSERVAEAADAAGVEYLRAPVSGNPTAVRAGILTIVASGPEAVFAEAEPVLRAIGPKVLYVGEGESARVVKLVFQILVGGTAELLSEALLLGEEAGVDRAKLLEAIGASAVGSPFVAYKSPPLLAGDYSATFTTALMLKDVDLVLDLAAERGVELPFATHLRALLEATAAAGHADEDFMALYLQLRHSLAGASNRDSDEVTTR